MFTNPPARRMAEWAISLYVHQEVAKAIVSWSHVSRNPLPDWMSPYDLAKGTGTNRIVTHGHAGTLFVW